MIGVDDFRPRRDLLATRQRPHGLRLGAGLKGINTLSFWAPSETTAAVPGGAAADGCPASSRTPGTRTSSPCSPAGRPPRRRLLGDHRPGCRHCHRRGIHLRHGEDRGHRRHGTDGEPHLPAGVTATPSPASTAGGSSTHPEHDGGHGLRHLTRSWSTERAPRLARGGPLPDRHRRRHLRTAAPWVSSSVHRRPAGLAQGPHLKAKWWDHRRGARHHGRVGRVAGPRRLLSPPGPTGPGPAESGRPRSCSSGHDTFGSLQCGR